MAVRLVPGGIDDELAVGRGAPRLHTLRSRLSDRFGVSLIAPTRRDAGAKSRFEADQRELSLLGRVRPAASL